MDSKLIFIALLTLIPAITLIGVSTAQIENTGNNNPYALPDDHPTTDREYPTLRWCPNGPWTVSEDTTLQLSMHDNSRFRVIEYHIAGEVFDLLNNSTNSLTLPLGYFEGTLIAEDVHGNSESRYGYAINFTAPSILTINMLYQENQADTYDCAGFQSQNSWMQLAWADSQQFSQLTITAGNVTDQLRLAQVQLETLKVELAILEAELELKENTGYTAEYVQNLNMTHQAEMNDIVTEVNATLILVNEVKQDVSDVLALCRD